MQLSEATPHSHQGFNCGYQQPTEEDDPKANDREGDFTCSINASDWLNKEINDDGTLKHIRHGSTGTQDWKEARAKRETSYFVGANHGADHWPSKNSDTKIFPYTKLLSFSGSTMTLLATR